MKYVIQLYLGKSHNNFFVNNVGVDVVSETRGS